MWRGGRFALGTGALTLSVVLLVAGLAASRGLGEGDGTPIHLVIPTPNPWVPLRILALGREPVDRIEADVFLLTDAEPDMLPEAETPNPFAPDQTGLILDRSEHASPQLVADLRSDRGMGWMPDDLWLSYLRVNVPAGDLTYDLAIDGSGAGHPDPAATGLEGAATIGSTAPDATGRVILVVFAAIAISVAITEAGRRSANRRAA